MPFAAVKGFLDPYVQFGLQFETLAVEPGRAETPPAETPEAAATAETAKTDVLKVVSLDSFRKKT